jgi:hypothetical protein
MRAMTRRKFLKRGGGATVAAFVALNLSLELASATGAHSPSSCSHLVKGTPAGSAVKSSGIQHGKYTAKAVYDSIPASGLGKSVTVRCQIELTKSTLLGDEVEFGAALNLTGVLGAGCAFLPTFPDSYDSIEISDLEQSTADDLYKYYAILNFSSDVWASDSRVVSGTLSFVKAHFHYEDVDGNPATADPGYVHKGNFTLASEAIEMRVEKI